LPWKKTSECVFQIRTRKNFQNFHTMGKNGKMGGKKETQGVKREKFSTILS
jgi:hypothetical protein